MEPERPASVAFDRAAGYYDATRGFSEQGERKMTALLSGELAGRGLVLEVGVGTGQVALPLHAAGIPVMGIDLARPMMDVLIDKAGGRSPIPLVQADATRMPFGDDAFGAAYLRWVLHLIPDWRTAVAEMARVVLPGGVLLTSIGSYGGPRSEIQERFAELAGVTIEPVGLTWSGYEGLDEAMAELGAAKRELPPIVETERNGLQEFIDGIANNAYSWTWKIEDPTRLAQVADEVRRWTEIRYGPLAEIPRETFEVLWVAYDLPG
jgi:ubiquinone/menaquinone biosynthesis C-methylase UbiE